MNTGGKGGEKQIIVPWTDEVFLLLILRSTDTFSQGLR